MPCFKKKCSLFVPLLHFVQVDWKSTGGCSRRTSAEILSRSSFQRRKTLSSVCHQVINSLFFPCLPSLVSHFSVVKFVAQRRVTITFFYKACHSYSFYMVSTLILAFYIFFFYVKICIKENIRFPCQILRQLLCAQMLCTLLLTITK